jgi:fermentation-respiration switch protein FrsA (DUF1100 family)
MAARPDPPRRRASPKHLRWPTIGWRPARGSTRRGSLGGGAVCDLALRRPSAALILMSCFTSVRAFAPRYLAPAFLIRDPFDNLSAVRRYPGPVLVIHGRRDEVVPFDHGQELYAAARKAQMFVCEAGHNDCPPDWEAFWEEVEAFLKTHAIR